MSAKIQVTRSPSNNNFSLNVTCLDSAEEAQQELLAGGSDEEIVAFIALDPSDPGEAALAAVLELAIEVNLGKEVGAESFLLKIFMAGRKSVA